MPTPGTIVLIEFQGAHQRKRRPALVVSSSLYHSNRPDIILGIITKKIDQAAAPTDHIIQDWQPAGLHVPSSFRAFLETHPATTIIHEIGNLTQRDWEQIQICLRRAIAFENLPPPSPPARTPTRTMDI
jgi:mRNA interferase MazF